MTLWDKETPKIPRKLFSLDLLLVAQEPPLRVVYFHGGTPLEKTFLFLFFETSFLCLALELTL